MMSVMQVRSRLAPLVCCWVTLMLTLSSGTHAAADPAAACTAALSPFSEITESIWKTCVAKQDGLQAIIDGFKDFMIIDAGAPNQTIPLDPVTILFLLETSEHGTEADKLRKCIATEKKQVKEDGSINMSGLQQSIKDAVANQPIAANVEKGLKNCKPVTDYKVMDYVGCVEHYCIYGRGFFNPTLGGTLH